MLSSFCFWIPSVSFSCIPFFNNYLKISSLLKWVPWLFPLPLLIHLLINLMLLLASIRPIRESWVSKSLKASGIIVLFLSGKFHEMPMQKKKISLITVFIITWVKGKSRVNIPVIIKLVPGGLHRKHINCFIRGIPLGIYRENQTAPFLGKLTLLWFLSSSPDWLFPQK